MAAGISVPHGDFREIGFTGFPADQSRRILERSRELGFPLKIHADEFDNLKDKGDPESQKRFAEVAAELDLAGGRRGNREQAQQHDRLAKHG